MAGLGRLPRRGHEDALETWTTHVDPATAAVLGRRDHGRSAMSVVVQLHADLLLRDLPGKDVVGAAGLALLASAVSGLVLWWPREGWRRAFRIAPRPRGRLLLDLHRVPGAVAALLLVASAYSGVALVYPGLAAAPLAPVARPTPLVPPKIVPRDAPYAVGADRAVAAAEAALPGHRAAFLSPPEEPLHLWQVLLKPFGADPAAGARVRAWVEPWDGAVVGTRSGATGTGADRWMDMQISIHGGGILGGAGRAAVCAGGIALALLSVTGPVLYARRLRARRRSAARRAAFGVSPHP